MPKITIPINLPDHGEVDCHFEYESITREGIPEVCGLGLRSASQTLPVLLTDPEVAMLLRYAADYIITGERL